MSARLTTPAPLPPLPLRQAMPSPRACWPAAPSARPRTPWCTCTAPSCGRWTPAPCCRPRWTAASGAPGGGAAAAARAGVAGPRPCGSPLHRSAGAAPRCRPSSWLPSQRRCSPHPRPTAALAAPGCTRRACWTRTPTCTFCTWTAGRAWRRCRPLASASRAPATPTARRARTCCWCDEAAGPGAAWGLGKPCGRATANCCAYRTQPDVDGDCSCVTLTVL